jgi:hypothetical protein
MSLFRKRSQWDDKGEPEQQVDDLTVAASFAHVPVYQYKPVEAEAQASDREKPECSSLAIKDPESGSDEGDNDVVEEVRWRMENMQV